MQEEAQNRAGRLQRGREGKKDIQAEGRDSLSKSQEVGPGW